jgi:predicted nucleic acid-binding protein
MVLADTSVWIRHFRQGEPTLADRLSEGLVLMHPFVSGELACGNLRTPGASRDPTWRGLSIGRVPLAARIVIGAAP